MAQVDWEGVQEELGDYAPWKPSSAAENALLEVQNARRSFVSTLNGTSLDVCDIFSDFDPNVKRKLH